MEDHPLLPDAEQMADALLIMNAHFVTNPVLVGQLKVE
jgi:hypothetical protein